jgi:hypothetical protein
MAPSKMSDVINHPSTSPHATILDNHASSIIMASNSTTCIAWDPDAPTIRVAVAYFDHRTEFWNFQQQMRWLVRSWCDMKSMHPRNVRTDLLIGTYTPNDPFFGGLGCTNETRRNKQVKERKQIIVASGTFTNHAFITN